MDLKINKKESFIDEWIGICLGTSKEYIYVLDEDIFKIITDYSDLIYEKIIKNNKIYTTIENALKDEIDNVILNEETIIESNRILVDILLDELDYTYQIDNNL